MDHGAAVVVIMKELNRMMCVKQDHTSNTRIILCTGTFTGSSVHTVRVGANSYWYMRSWKQGMKLVVWYMVPYTRYRCVSWYRTWYPGIVDHKNTTGMYVPVRRLIITR